MAFALVADKLMNRHKNSIKMWWKIELDILLFDINV